MFKEIRYIGMGCIVYNTGIEEDINNHKPHLLIARKIFLCYPTNAFSGKEDIKFEIFNAISEHFNIPITSIQVAGSAKTGYSYFKAKNFAYGESDLDIAIISMELFSRYTEIVYSITKGFSDLSQYPVKKDRDYLKEYLGYLGKGIFRPDLMPISKEKERWFGFFNRLSGSHVRLFKGINAGIYASQFFYESKQIDSITRYVTLKREGLI